MSDIKNMEFDHNLVNIALAHLAGWPQESVFKDDEKVYVSYDEGQTLLEFSYEDSSVLEPLCEKYQKWPEKHDEKQWICKVNGKKPLVVMSEDKNYATALAISLEFFVD